MAGFPIQVCSHGFTAEFITFVKGVPPGLLLRSSPIFDLPVKSYFSWLLQATCKPMIAFKFVCPAPKFSIYRPRKKATLKRENRNRQSFFRDRRCVLQAVSDNGSICIHMQTCLVLLCSSGLAMHKRPSTAGAEQGESEEGSSLSCGSSSKSQKRDDNADKAKEVLLRILEDKTRQVDSLQKKNNWVRLFADKKRKLAH